LESGCQFRRDEYFSKPEKTGDGSNYLTEEDFKRINRTITNKG
jgi:hypothetical protein